MAFEESQRLPTMRLLLDGFFNAAGHENNRLLGFHGFNTADDLKATLLRHFEVTDHHIIITVLDLRGHILRSGLCDDNRWPKTVHQHVEEALQQGKP